VTPFLNLCIKYNKKQVQVETMWNLEPLGSLPWVGWMWLNFITGCRALWNDPFRQFGTPSGEHILCWMNRIGLCTCPEGPMWNHPLRQFGNPEKSEMAFSWVVNGSRWQGFFFLIFCFLVRSIDGISFKWFVTWAPLSGCREGISQENPMQVLSHMWGGLPTAKRPPLFSLPSLAGIILKTHLWADSQIHHLRIFWICGLILRIFTF
jgi:hypothetical protein